MLLKLVIRLSLIKMYIPNRHSIWAESNDPMVTLKLSALVFTQMVSLLISINFLHANIIYNSF